MEPDITFRMKALLKCNHMPSEEANICNRCFGSITQSKSLDQLVQYIEALARLHAREQVGINLWAMHNQVLYNSNSLFETLEKQGKVKVAKQQSDGKWAYDSGFRYDEDPGIMVFTRSGFVDRWEPNWSEQAIEFISDIHESELRKEDSDGYQAHLGRCANCKKKVNADEIVCTGCFSPLIPQSSYAARAVYGEVMESIGTGLALQDSPKFDAWKSQFETSVASMANQFRERQTGASTKFHFDPALRFLIFGILGSSALAGFIASDNVVQKGFMPGVFLIYLAAFFTLTIWIFIKVWIKCPSCDFHNSRKNSAISSKYLGSRQGTHTALRTTFAHTDHYSRSGSRVGSSERQSYTPVQVAHVDHFYRQTYECSNCAYQWDVQVKQRS
jgi:hypothetical protein